VLTASAGSVTQIPSSACYQLPSPFDVDQAACYSLPATFPAVLATRFVTGTKIDGVVNATTTTVPLNGQVLFEVTTDFPSFTGQSGVSNQFYIGELRQLPVDCINFAGARQFVRSANITFPTPGCRVIGQKFDQQNSCSIVPATTAVIPLGVVWVPYTTAPPPVSAPTSSCKAVSVAPTSAPTNAPTSAPTAAPPAAAANSAQAMGPFAVVLLSLALLSF